MRKGPACNDCQSSHGMRKGVGSICYGPLIGPALAPLPSQEPPKEVMGPRGLDTLVCGQSTQY
jgi:hypothetical protein